MNASLARLLKINVLLTGALTAVSGAVLIVLPGPILDLLDADNTAASRHFFAIIGMFMLLFGGMTWATLRAKESSKFVIFWAGLQKLGASAAVMAGVANDLFSPLALAIAALDLVSSVIYFAYRSTIKT